MKRVNLQWSVAITALLVTLVGFMTPTSAEAQVDKPFIIASQMPVFQEKGNLLDFRNWATKQIKYPAEAKKNGVEGKVIATFVVEKDGSVGSVEILRSPNKLLSAETKRILQSSPKWTPAAQNGEKVRLKYTIPIDFRIANTKSK